MNLKYEILTKENLDLMKELQHTIFPETSFEEGYDLVMEHGPTYFGAELQDYYIAYMDGEPVGIMGLYIPGSSKEHHSIWLGWYGILPSARGKGIGKKILFDSIEMAKEYKKKFPIKYFRLYTDEVVNSSAQPLYNKVMDLKEYYRNEEMFSDKAIELAKKTLPGKTDEEYKEMLSTKIAIFSKSIDENEILMPWENRSINLTRIAALEKNNL